MPNRVSSQCVELSAMLSKWPSVTAEAPGADTAARAYGAPLLDATELPDARRRQLLRTQRGPACRPRPASPRASFYIYFETRFTCLRSLARAGVRRISPTTPTLVGGGLAAHPGDVRAAMTGIIASVVVINRCWSRSTRLPPTIP